MRTLNNKAVIIGAGQIGRGFIGQVLSDSGYSLLFVDVQKEIVDLINEAGEYQVIMLDDEHRPKTVAGIRAVCFSSVDAPREIAGADIIATACGPNNIQNAASFVAAGIRERIARGNTLPLNIIACENMANGTEQLRKYVYELLAPGEIAFCDNNIGFPNCEVSRLVVPDVNIPPLAVKVEKYMEWIIDRGKTKGDLSGIHGLILSDHVDAYIARKIFSLTGHAMLGFMGYAAGYKYIWEAVYDHDVFRRVYGALEECGRAWSIQYGLPLNEFMEYSSLMLVRFADQRINDPVTRPARDPIRKLSASERFFKPALTALANDIDPVNIIKGIRAVCGYDYPDDPEAVLLQRMIREKGPLLALSEISGLAPEHPLIADIIGDE